MILQWRIACGLSAVFTAMGSAQQTGQGSPCVDGRVAGFACRNVELLAYLPATTIGHAGGSDIWGWTDSAAGREFLLVGGYEYGSTTAFIDVTDPVHPQYLGVLPPHDTTLTQRNQQAVKVYQHYAFITYDGSRNGLQIFDLTQLRDVRTPTVFHETAHYDVFESAHTITVNPGTGFLYANGVRICGGGMHIDDVRQPTTPVPIGCYADRRMTGPSGAGYVHDSQCVVYHGPDRRYQGREICIHGGQSVLAISDVTDKQHPTTIATASYPNVGFAHQGWFTDDQRYVFLDDELDEVGGPDAVFTNTGSVMKMRTMVFDVSDLHDPVVATEYFAPIDGIDHNLFIRGRYMYQGDNEAGLRIIDVVDPKHPQEVGYLSGIGAAFGTYPFLKHDVVAVSTSEGVVLARLSK